MNLEDVVVNPEDVVVKEDVVSIALPARGGRIVYVADQEVDERIELYLRPIDGSASATKLDDPLVAGGDVAAFGLGAPAFLFTADSGAVVYYLADQDSDEVFELYRRSLP